jgi:hypothetical protein
LLLALAKRENQKKTKKRRSRTKRKKKREGRNKRKKEKEIIYSDLCNRIQQNMRDSRYGSCPRTF